MELTAQSATHTRMYICMYVFKRPTWRAESIKPSSPVWIDLKLCTRPFLLSYLFFLFLISIFFLYFFRLDITLTSKKIFFFIYFKLNYVEFYYVLIAYTYTFTHYLNNIYCIYIYSSVHLNCFPIHIILFHPI